MPFALKLHAITFIHTKGRLKAPKRSDGLYQAYYQDTLNYKAANAEL